MLHCSGYYAEEFPFTLCSQVKTQKEEKVSKRFEKKDLVLLRVFSQEKRKKWIFFLIFFLKMERLAKKKSHVIFYKFSLLFLQNFLSNEGNMLKNILFNFFNFPFPLFSSIPKISRASLFFLRHLLFLSGKKIIIQDNFFNSTSFYFFDKINSTNF